MKINWRDWDVVVSPSQLETYADCIRKWFFEKIARLPRLDKGFQIFGQVVHQVGELYHEADDTGRDPKTGKPVDLFPEGWEVARSRFGKNEIMGSINPREQALIRKLVKKAIDEGIWTRQPGRQVELGMFRKISERLAIMGFIDLYMPGVMVDHKSAKNLGYAKTREELEEDTQMLSYAWEEFQRADEEGRELDEVEVRHNVFSKDPKNAVVKSTSGFITREQTDDFMAVVVDVAKDMRKLKKSGANIDTWHNVPGADESDPKACAKYGGCDFAGICGRTETPQQYITRIDRAQKAQAEAAQASTQGDNVSIFDKMDSKASAPKAAPESGSAPEQPTTQHERAPEAHPEVAVLHEEQVAAPWARPGCKKCNELGLNASGQPCAVCKAFAKREGRPHPDEFVLGTDDDGRITWTPKDGTDGEAGGTEAVAEPRAKDTTGADEGTQQVTDEAPAETPSEEPKAEPEKPAKGKKKSALEKRAAARSKKPKTETTEEPSEPAEAQESAGEAASEPEKPKTTRGRKKQGFTLLINTLPEQPKTGKTINLVQVWAEAGEALAEAMSVEGQKATFYELHALKRRDWMNARVRQIVATFGSATVIATGPFSPDFVEFLEAVKATPECGYVYRGVV